MNNKDSLNCTAKLKIYLKDCLDIFTPSNISVTTEKPFEEINQCASLPSSMSTRIG